MTKRSIGWLLLVSVSLSAAGCGVGSLSPIVPAERSHFDARLLGAWVDTSSHESALITGDSLQGYAITYVDSDGKQGQFAGQLGMLGRYRVLDVQPDDLHLDASGLYTSLLCRLHAPVVIDSIGGPTLRFRVIQPESLSTYVARRPRSVAHAIVDDGVVLTAPTPELRRFLLAFFARKGALGDQATFLRKAD